MIYFDDNAISYPDNEVLDILIDVYRNHFYNPNSVYNSGLESKRMWVASKEVIANEIGCNIDDLTICSGSSEANNMALLGYLRKHNEYHYITSPAEHSSVTANPYAKPLIGIDSNGLYKMEDIEKIHDKLVCLSLASSEIGVIQTHMKEIIEVLHSHNCVIHIDATASFLKQKINIHDLKPDMLCATAQKIHGVLGAAFLYVSPKIKIEPLIYGHGIEPLRAGTPNLPALCCLAKAIQIHNWDDNKKIQDMRNYFIDKLLDLKGVVLNGSTKRLCNNINIHIDGIDLDNQQLLAMLDLYGYALSSSSACNSGLKSPSATLLSLGLTEDQANRSLRISLSKYNTITEIDKFIKDLSNIIEQFSK